ncbi:MAG TPA: glycosyltransferase family 39 protein [Gemmataceae bacterium]|jgi:hypothetical protein
MRTLLPIVILAAVMTGLNAIKPLHVDDATFYFNAKQIASHPLDPYGYVMLRWSDAEPALHALAPPGLPYWWAAAIRMFGERPVAWKLWLFPLVLIFVASLAELLRRFGPSVAGPLLVLLVLSPVFLPSLNLMMDIPALALSTLALALFFRACDKESLIVAALAGLTAALAVQTKYTASLSPAVMLVYACLHRRLQLGLIAVFVSGLTFAAWEWTLFLRYGESHFVYQILHGDNGEQPKPMLLVSLFSLLGGAASTLTLLALTVLPGRRWLLLTAGLIVGFPFLLLLWPDDFNCDERVYQLASFLYTCNGALVLLSMGWVARRVVSPGSLPTHPRQAALFLVLWFALELVGYVAISPFPAVRRIMGTTVAATLLIAYLAERTGLESWQIKVLRGVVIVTALLGVGFFCVDLLEARAEQQAAYEAAQFIRREDPRTTIWYSGYWGFQYYAEKSGMKQIVPLRDIDGRAPSLLQPSRLSGGDWLVIPDESIPQQEMDVDRPELEPKGELTFGDAVPFATLMNYYAGTLPLRHHRGPRIVLRLYRAKDGFIAR